MKYLPLLLVLLAGCAPQPQHEFVCYIDDTMTWRAVEVSRRWTECNEGTCTVRFADSDNAVYYRLAEREFCSLEEVL